MSIKYVVKIFFVSWAACGIFHDRCFTTRLIFSFFILDESVFFVVFVSRIDRTEVSDKSRWTIKNGESEIKHRATLRPIFD